MPVVPNKFAWSKYYLLSLSQALSQHSHHLYCRKSSLENQYNPPGNKMGEVSANSLTISSLHRKEFHQLSVSFHLDIPIDSFIIPFHCFRLVQLSLFDYYKLPSPPIILVISSILSIGKGGCPKGFIAMDISFIGLSSAATRLELSVPHVLHL